MGTHPPVRFTWIVHTRVHKYSVHKIPYPSSRRRRARPPTFAHLLNFSLANFTIQHEQTTHAHTHRIAAVFQQCLFTLFTRSAVWLLCVGSGDEKECTLEWILWLGKLFAVCPCCTRDPPDPRAPSHLRQACCPGFCCRCTHVCAFDCCRSGAVTVSSTSTWPCGAVRCGGATVSVYFACGWVRLVAYGEAACKCYDALGVSAGVLRFRTHSETPHKLNAAYFKWNIIRARIDRCDAEAAAQMRTPEIDFCWGNCKWIGSIIEFWMQYQPLNMCCNSTVALAQRRQSPDAADPYGGRIRRAHTYGCAGALTHSVARFCGEPIENLWIVPKNAKRTTVCKSLSKSSIGFCTAAAAPARQSHNICRNLWRLWSAGGPIVLGENYIHTAHIQRWV